LFDIEVARVDIHQCQWPVSHYPVAMASLDLDFDLLRCEQQIADLGLRINQLREIGTLASAEYIGLLQKTLESWRERKRTLLASASESAGADSRL
jgi:hypothetical protein